MRTYCHVSHQQYAEDLCSHLIKWLKRKSRRLSREWLEAALILIRLNMEPARSTLESLYSPDPRGRKPYDPVCMLRALLLMVLLRYTSITKWAEALKARPRLARMAGFESFDTPAAGTFYLFMDRLEDGKYQKPCEHRVKPSMLRKGKHLRNLANEKEQRQKDAEMNATVYDSITKKLKDDLIASKDQYRPDDLLRRLEDIFIQCAIIPSAERGLLGDTNSLSVVTVLHYLLAPVPTANPRVSAEKKAYTTATAPDTTRTQLLTGDMTHTENATTSVIPSTST